MTKLPYQPPTISTLGSLEDLTLANAGGFLPLDVFACVNGIVQAQVGVGVGAGIDIIVALPVGTCETKGVIGS